MPAMLERPFQADNVLLVFWVGLFQLVQNVSLLDTGLIPIGCC